MPTTVGIRTNIAVTNTFIKVKNIYYYRPMLVELLICNL